MALYETFEYAMCYKEEKKKNKQAQILNNSAHELMTLTSPGSSERSRSVRSERQALLQEEQEDDRRGLLDNEELRDVALHNETSSGEEETIYDCHNP